MKLARPRASRRLANLAFFERAATVPRAGRAAEVSLERARELGCQPTSADRNESGTDSAAYPLQDLLRCSLAMDDD